MFKTQRFVIEILFVLNLLKTLNKFHSWLFVCFFLKYVEIVLSKSILFEEKKNIITMQRNFLNFNCEEVIVFFF